MNKQEYADFHYLLAKLKYELQIVLLECDANSKYAKQVRTQIGEIDDIMKIFIIENE